MGINRGKLQDFYQISCGMHDLTIVIMRWCPQTYKGVDN